MPKVETELLVLSLKAQAPEPTSPSPSLRACEPEPRAQAHPSSNQDELCGKNIPSFWSRNFWKRKKNLRKNFFWTWKKWTEDVFLSVSFSSERNGNVATRSVSAEKCCSKVFLIRLLETSSHRYQRSCEGRLFSQAVLIKHCSFFAVLHCSVLFI